MSFSQAIFIIIFKEDLKSEKKYMRDPVKTYFGPLKIQVKF